MSRKCRIIYQRPKHTLRIQDSRIVTCSLEHYIYSNNYQANTVWLADRSFLKLRNAEVYYRFPKEWMKKTKILGSAKLYVRGTDLFCSDHIDVTDPECYGVATLLNKSVVVGVTIGF